jgi:hypothetical protein
MPEKRPLWSKVTININHLLNIVHHQKVRAIPLPGPPRRPLKNVTAQISQAEEFFTFNGILSIMPDIEPEISTL